MFFDLTDEQRMIQRTMKEFADEVVAPGAIERDKKKAFPKEIFQQLAEMGMMGLPFPEEYGGAGADTISFAIVTEELSRVCASTGITYSAHISLGGAPLNLFGTKEQKERYLTPICTGESFGAFGLTEANAGSDAGGTETRAVLENNQFTINGSKMFITNASYAKHLALTAITDIKDGKKEISAIIVPTNAKGFTIIDEYEKMGLNASNTTELILENVVVPEENLLGTKGNGFKQFLQTLDGGRIGIAAMAVGIAQGAMNKAVQYAKERKQFGKALAEFQATQFKLADMAVKIEIARTYVYKAAWLKDQGRPFSKEAAIAKYYASEMAMEVCDEAIQIHGGYGYMREYEVERYMRDAKLLEIGEGTSEVQKLVIARHILDA
ncbi:MULTISPECIES: acyl-CoA dehydrogenase family protein [Bacillales]|uniref:Acyl-CoA dehydrogenase family protein n=1 Tax=Lysinibacillus louembei TaxID=1470088 RepID=A0ABZ0RXJ8_9BACI|nr:MULTISPECIES: acyl-CoA dehydrogenase family protein [Bacillales]MCT6922567.1 acyl-CoA dehydrogenase family protein [Metasolibacillus sp.]MCT6939094.1 acyl-CoA dehydrogenase family protein [Metasolibacillus sp.]WPK11538.1 acyl-CoA dehydrogenase family protein [Lysinibacillus louembei]